MVWGSVTNKRHIWRGIQLVIWRREGDSPNKVLHRLQWTELQNIRFQLLQNFATNCSYEQAKRLPNTAW